MSVEALWTEALRRAQSGDVVGAAEMFRDAAALAFPTEVGVLMAWADCEARVGNPTAAMAALDCARAHAPSDPLVVSRAARLQQSLGNSAKAIDLAVEAIRAWRTPPLADPEGSVVDFMLDCAAATVRPEAEHERLEHELVARAGRQGESGGAAGVKSAPACSCPARLRVSRPFRSGLQRDEPTNCLA